MAEKRKPGLLSFGFTKKSKQDDDNTENKDTQDDESTENKDESDTKEEDETKNNNMNMEGGASAVAPVRKLFNIRLPWVVYRVGINKEPLDDWLEKYKPSTVCKDEGFRWICVVRKNPDDSDEDKSEDKDDSEDNDGSDELKDEWKALKTSERNICKEKIFELAKKFEKTTGKWMFWVSPGGEGDHFWSLVAKGIANGKILANQAKISAFDKNGPDTSHVVCIYNDNFLDEEQVYESERTIRSLGIKCPLHYKPDIFTHLGVYRKNPWGIRPTIYTSYFDNLKNQSIIKEN